MTTNASLTTFDKLLEAQGLKSGLMFLNQRVPYRFTALYQLDQSRLLRLGFVDKQDGDGEEFAEVPFRDSFCEITARDGHLKTADPFTDPRLKGNPYAAVIGSYVGLPMARRAGELLGTFCHYDVCSHPVDDQEFEFLQEAISRLGAYCMRPGMPFGPHAVN